MRVVQFYAMPIEKTIQIALQSNFADFCNALIPSPSPACGRRESNFCNPPLYLIGLLLLLLQFRFKICHRRDAEAQRRSKKEKTSLLRFCSATLRLGVEGFDFLETHQNQFKPTNSAYVSPRKTAPLRAPLLRHESRRCLRPCLQSVLA